MVAGAVRQSIRAVVAVMVCELVTEVVCATMCEVMAVTVAVMVNGTKTWMPGSMQGRAQAAGSATACERATGTLIELLSR